MKFTVYHQGCVSLRWTWHDLYRELVLHLIDKYKANVVYDEGFDTIDHGDGYVQSVPKLWIDKWNINIPDSEILIYDEENDILRGISFSESWTKIIDLFIERNNPNDILLLTQQNNAFHTSIHHTGNIPTFPFKLKRTTFYPFNPIYNMEYFYHERRFKKKDDLIDKMVCLTTPLTGRNDLQELSNRGVLDFGTGFNYDDYLAKLIQYKIGLSIAGSAEICHREIEYMAIGLPNLHLTYMTQLDPPLLPNHHYIEVNSSQFPKDMWLNRAGGPEYVDAYINRFMEVKDDVEFLDFIVHNGRQYYLENCSPQNRLSVLLKQLEF